MQGRFGDDISDHLKLAFCALYLWDTAGWVLLGARFGQAQVQHGDPCH